MIDRYTYLILLDHIIYILVAAQSNVYTTVDGLVELKCPQHTASSETAWFRSGQVSQISVGHKLNAKMDKKRYKIIGDRSNGIYNLKILNVKQSDFGEYSCTITNGNVSQLFHLNLIQLSKFKIL